MRNSAPGPSNLPINQDVSAFYSYIRLKFLNLITIRMDNVILLENLT